ncbi:hypothetical protein ACFWUZ_34960 [Streptomyces sp. NPDC058646]|uniref:hypothetical protein n=1 Tax=Streptomyces sp. NPDC058646 TaxID=3346574 RepID=UPI00366401BC
MPELLVDVIERIVVPVTTLPGPEAGEPSTETFALEALGRVLMTSRRTWAQSGPDAAESIACAVIDFAVQFLTGHSPRIASPVTGSTSSASLC